MKQYLVGQNTDYENKAWQFGGIFSTKEKAIAACKSADMWWAEVMLDEEMPLETTQFEVYGYPIKSSQK